VSVPFFVFHVDSWSLRSTLESRRVAAHVNNEQLCNQTGAPI
jgi:hypothetical protein